MPSVGYTYSEIPLSRPRFKQNKITDDNEKADTEIQHGDPRTKTTTLRSFYHSISRILSL